MCVVLDWAVRVGLHISFSVIGTQCQCEVVCQGKDWLILQQECSQVGLGPAIISLPVSSAQQ